MSYCRFLIEENIMKLYFCLRLKTLFKISKFKSHLKYFSTQKPEIVIEALQQRAPVETSCSSFDSKYWIVPNLKRDRVEILSNVTGIAMELNHVSWASISTPTLSVSSWDAFKLPDNFNKEINDIRILEVASLIVSQIPKSDLYVMKCRPEKMLLTSQICLRSMLVVLINDLYKGSKNDIKIVFLKSFVLNVLHQLLVGAENVSVKQALERKHILMSSKSKNEKNQKALENNDIIDCFSSVNIQDKLLYSFVNCKRESQECLLHSLILALTFLDVYFFQNPKSIQKILQSKKKFKKNF